MCPLRSGIPPGFANGYGLATRARRTKQSLQGGGGSGTLFYYTALPFITSLSSPYVGTLWGGGIDHPRWGVLFPPRM